jgi:two-component system heavy metal sensor histidine kinase CusS
MHIKIKNFFTRYSITGRLTILYTTFTFALLLVVNIILFKVISSNLEREDYQFLRNKINVIRVILQRDDTRRGLAEEIIWEGYALQFTRYFARLIDSNGNILIETPHMLRLLKPSFFPPQQKNKPAELSKRIKTNSEQTYLLMSAYSNVNERNKNTKVIQVALDITNEENIIKNYGEIIIFILIGGLIFAGLIGAYIAKKGMEPLKNITETTGNITSSRLNQRIGSMNWPKELTVLAKAFDEMLNRLEDSFNRLSQFSADIAHELRTPINNLMGEAEVALSKERSAANYKRVLESNLEEGQRISALIESLLFLARAENSEIKLEKTQFNAKIEIKKIIEFYQSSAEEKNIKFICNGNANVTADPVLFNRAIINLISNSIKYCKENGEVKILLKQTGNNSTEIEIIDNGIGIASEHISKVFDRFYQVDVSRANSIKGTGLGLSIVKSIMELHNGTINIRSEINKGTSIKLIFPA